MNEQLKEGKYTWCFLPGQLFCFPLYLWPSPWIEWASLSETLSCRGTVCRKVCFLSISDSPRLCVLKGNVALYNSHVLGFIIRIVIGLSITKHLI